MINATSILTNEIWKLLETVTDPEVPVLSILDLGIVRDVKLNDDQVEVVITPTYTGCPAMDVIGMQIKMALLQNGYKHIKVTQILSPAWTTDWMTDAGKEKLRSYGIAAPQYKTTDEHDEEETPSCPLCNSTNTRLVSQFGSTACKALYQCNDCKEPFDYFKCH